MNRLTDIEKKKILKGIFDDNHHSVGRNFPVFSQLMDGMGHASDMFTFAELIPAFNTYITGARVAAVHSSLSFAVILIFPVQQIINLINANDTGFRMYSFRSVSYAITAWSFDKPLPSQSPRIIRNLRLSRTHEAMARYHDVWREASSSAINSMNKVCLEKGISKSQLKAIFRAFGNGDPRQLCKLILSGFEPEFGHTTAHIWRNSYNVLYPD